METTREKFDKLIYTDFEDYQSLSPGDQAFFDKLFDYLIYYGNITWSNKKLCEMLGESESTLEKRLSRLEKNRLIIREVSKQCDFGQWRTVDRIIKLNPFNFDFDYNSMAHRIFVNYLFSKKADFVMNKYLDMPYADFVKAFAKIKVVSV